MGSIVKNYTDYYDNLFWNYNNSTEYRPLQMKDISYTGTITITVDELEKKMEEWKGDNMERINNILNLYKEHQIREFDRQCNEDIEFIRKTSVLANVTEKLRKQAKKELEKLYPDKDYEDIKYYIYLGYENDKKTQEAINERLDYRKEQIEKLERNLDDIKALIAIAETFDEKMQILKNYEVIDEDGKIKSW